MPNRIWPFVPISRNTRTQIQGFAGRQAVQDDIRGGVRT